MSEFVTEVDEEREYILEFLTRLQGKWPNAHIIMMPENTGDPMGAFRIERYWQVPGASDHRLLQNTNYSSRNPGFAQGTGRIYTVCESKDEKRKVPGINTTEDQKRIYAALTAQLLSDRKFYMLVEEHFITLHERLDGADEETGKRYRPSVCSPHKYNACINLTRKQMYDYSRECKKVRDPDQKIHGTEKFKFSGKRWGPDDVAVTVQMCNRWSFFFACGHGEAFNNAFDRSELPLIETPVNLVNTHTRVLE